MSLAMRTNHNTISTIDVYFYIYPDRLPRRTDFHSTPAVEPFVLLFLANFCYLVLGSVARFPLLATPPEMASPWRSAFCLSVTRIRYASCLRLICFAGAGLRHL